MGLKPTTHVYTLPSDMHLLACVYADVHTGVDTEIVVGMDVGVDAGADTGVHGVGRGTDADAHRVYSQARITSFPDVCVVYTEPHVHRTCTEVCDPQHPCPCMDITRQCSHL